MTVTHEHTGGCVDILIVGGGISGLSAADALVEAGRDVAVLEAGDHPGGVIGSERDSDWLVETGPNTLLVKPALHALLSRIGLDGEAIFADKLNAKRYVLLNGRMRALPSGPVGALTSPLVAPVLPRLLAEPWTRRGDAADESIAAFVERRLGRHMADVLVDAFVSGIYAGDPSRLSLRAAFPRLYALDQQHGSLVRGALAAMQRARRDKAHKPALPKQWRRGLISFPDGLQALPQRLAERLRTNGATYCPGSPAVAIGRDGQDWLVRDGQGRVWRASHLVLATPAPVSASLLRHTDDALADMLGRIVYAPIAAVALGFAANAVRHPLDGFGLLLPRREGRRTLGALFSSSLFPGRAPDGHRLISAFIGGRRDPDAVLLDDDELAAQVQRDVGDLLGLSSPPVWRKIRRWQAAIPQYEIGHCDLLAQIDGRLAHHPHLSLMGNWRDGISVGDCLENGRKLAESLLTSEKRHPQPAAVISA